MTQPIKIITKYIAPTWIECAYCAARFAPGDPTQNDHWRDCEKHPARAELRQAQNDIDQLRADNDALRQAVKALEKNQAKLAGATAR